MTNLSKTINTLDQLTNAIDEHKHKYELIELINSQVADDTYIVLSDTE